jgi:hypothetical protein
MVILAAKTREERYLIQYKGRASNIAQIPPEHDEITTTEPLNPLRGIANLITKDRQLGARG